MLNRSHSFSKVTQVRSKSARAFVGMFIGREGGGRDMIRFPTSHRSCGPLSLTMVQEAMLASWPVRFDQDGC